MNHDHYSDAYLRGILTEARTIAVVGASPRPHRPSHGVMRFLQRHGYRAIPVNPNAAGEFAAAKDIDHVDRFRNVGEAGIDLFAENIAARGVGVHRDLSLIHI